MNFKVLLLLLGAPLWLGCQGLSAEGDDRAAKIKHFYDWMDNDSWCGNTFFGLPEEFAKAFPEKNQADVLAEIIQRALDNHQPQAVFRAMGVLMSLSSENHPIAWNHRLETILLAQAHSPDPDMRSTLADVLVSTKSDSWRPTILAFLKDPDDKVRNDVLYSIWRAKWSDMVEIAKKYIKDNVSGKTYPDSVLTACDMSNAEDDKRAEWLDSQRSKPDAQALYLKYIAQHKDDLDFAVSVRNAQNLWHDIQSDLDYQKSVQDDKDREAKDKKLTADLDAGLPSPVHTVQEKVDLFYYLFSKSHQTSFDGDAYRDMYGVALFPRVVSFEERAAVLAALAQKAIKEPINQSVFRAVLYQALTQPDDPPEKRIWNSDLEAAICSQIHNPDMFTRMTLIQVLEGWHLENRRDVLLSMLQNDDNEMVREYAIGAIYRWTDGKALLQAFAKDNQTNPKDIQIVHAIHDLVPEK